MVNKIKTYSVYYLYFGGGVNEISLKRQERGKEVLEARCVSCKTDSGQTPYYTQILIIKR